MTDTFPFSFDSETTPPSRAKKKRRGPRASVVAVWVLSVILAIVLVLFFVAAGVLNAGANSLVAGTKVGHEISSKLAGGTKEINSGMQTLDGGLGKLSSGTQTYASATQQLANGASQAASQVGQLSSAVSLAATGTSALSSALNTAAAKTPLLVELANGLTGGVNQAVQGFQGIQYATGTSGTVNVNGTDVPVLGATAANVLSAINQNIAPFSQASPVGQAEITAALATKNITTNATILDQCLVGLSIVAEDSSFAAEIPTANWAVWCPLLENATELSGGIGYLNTEAATAVTDGGMLYSEMSNTLVPAVTTLNSGMQQLAPVAAKLSGGMAELNGLMGPFQSGMNTLASGTTQVATGADGISSALDTANMGAGKLAQGMNLVNTGADKLNGGMAYLQNVTGELQSGTSSVSPQRLGIPVGIVAIIIIILAIIAWILVSRAERRRNRLSE